MKPQSKELELKVLNNLLDMAKKSIIEEMPKSFGETERQKNCYRLINGEQRSLRVLIEVTESAIRLLNEPSKKIALDYCISLSEKPYSHYLNEIFLTLH